MSTPRSPTSASCCPTTTRPGKRDPACQLAVERLWILAGETSERYRRDAGIPRGVEPWRELRRYRNLLAHQEPAERDPGRVWTETIRDLDRLRTDMRAHRQHP
ncbi:hypothetical protein ER308_01220 [Egibacter rhizosphaerae]|uniref:DUF86 domain-containing protein n=1 Tax=Egibacter rhizosphaerae TaxID=1670831 RepID=A0A411YAV3_9ACTN|nr:hypothetical protein [Egibacter rhizosphaerae]QBI18325.1 hypothetical protein ER308_01220 [Egibacter rhizosphaerae]